MTPWMCWFSTGFTLTFKTTVSYLTSTTTYSWLAKTISSSPPTVSIAKSSLTCPKMPTQNDLSPLASKTSFFSTKTHSLTQINPSLQSAKTSLSCLTLSSYPLKSGATLKGLLKVYKKMYSLFGIPQSAKWTINDKLSKASASTLNQSKSSSNTTKSSPKWHQLLSSSLSYWFLSWHFCVLAVFSDKTWTIIIWS